MVDFSEKELEFSKILMKIGFKRTIAKVLVFLANTNEATSRAIERGADLRQPEVSIALNYLREREWIICREIKSVNKGRPNKNCKLSKPLSEILDIIEKEKKNELNNQIELFQKLNQHIMLKGVKSQSQLDQCE